MEKVDTNIFRAYDIRGIYPEELNEDVARRIAMAFTTLYPDAKKLVVAYDTRPSSPSLAKAIIEAFCAQGRDVINLGLAPDPLFYFTVFNHGYDGGMVVSGSHNLGAYNGISISAKNPDTGIVSDVVEEDMKKLERLVQEIDASEQADSKGTVTEFNPEKEYIDYVTKIVSLERSLKIILDSGNGAMGYLPEKVFSALGCEVETLYGEYDGSFPNHAPDPYNEENLVDIKKAVLEKGADIGFAYDADGDRVAMIDNTGRTVSGDASLFMLANQALEKKKGPIVHDMRVSKAFLDELEKKGVPSYFSISHHNAVIEKVIETKAVFGGEITLHFVFPLDYYLCDDALFASLKFCQVASKVSDVSILIDQIPRYYASKEIFVDTPDKEKFQIIQKLQEYLKDNDYTFVDVDGARIQFDNGWALARAANTSPFIKCRFEGQTKEDLELVTRKALDIFEEIGIPLKENHYKELGLRK